MNRYTPPKEIHTIQRIDNEILQRDLENRIEKYNYQILHQTKEQYCKMMNYILYLLINTNESFDFIFNEYLRLNYIYQQRRVWCNTVNTPLTEQRYSLWSSNPITTNDYLLSIRYMQTNTLPTTGDAQPTLYNFNTTSYDRNTFNTGIRVKQGAVNAGLV